MNRFRLPRYLGSYEIAAGRDVSNQIAPSGGPAGGRWLLGFLALLFSLTATFAASPNTTQTLSLYSGWNLISIQVGEGPLPVASFRAALSAPDRLVEIWGYQASGDPAVLGTWRTYQPAVTNFPSDLTHLDPGRGYWVNVAQTVTATLTGPAWSGAPEIKRGWNLVGFNVLSLGANEAQELASIFGSTFDRVTQVWTFDPAAQRFVGHDVTAIPAVKTLTNVSPGAGYWVYALEPLALAPQPYLALPQDADQSPLQLEELFAATDSRSSLVSNPASYDKLRVRYRGPEDVPFDLNNNGILDSPFTQDTLVFDIGVSTRIVSIGNNGTGAFPWSVTKDGSVPWLKFDNGTVPATAAFAQLLDSAAGVVSSDRDTVTFRVDRTTLAPGIHAAIAFVHLGGQTRTIKIRVVVPTAEGDWKGYASVTRVAGRKISVGKVDLAFSLFMNSTAPTETNFRAVLNQDRSLLFPKDVFMNGVFYSGSQFSLTTNFVMPPGDRNAPPYDKFQHDASSVRKDYDHNRNGRVDVANPFPMELNREVTLLGERKTPDRFEGTYVEAIGGLLPNGQLIFLEGDFILERETFDATKRSVVNSSEVATHSLGGSSGAGFVEREFTVAEVVTISETVVTVATQFPRPAALTITLRSPLQTTATLHRGGATLAPSATYTLANFNGQNGQGKWVLRIEWDGPSTPERGTLGGWTLNLKGISSYTVSGRIVTTGNAPLGGAAIILTGSNVIRQTVSDPTTGLYTFPDLTENNYTISAAKPGYVSKSATITVTDRDVTAGNIELAPLTVTEPTLAASPAIGAAPFHTSLLLQVPLSVLNTQVGANATAVWNFGDGSAPIADNANLSDDVTLNTAKHVYAKPGTYVAQVSLSGAAGSITKTVSIHAQASGADPLGPALQISQVSFVGSIAGARLANPDPPIQSTAPTTVAVSLTGGIVLNGVRAATVWQESKRDVAAFDIDRFPYGTAAGQYRPDEEDSDFSGDSTYTVYTPDSIGGQPLPEKWRLRVTLGGAIGSTAPSIGGNFRLHVGTVEP